MNYVLLDLDGTLLDTTELILESYRYTLRKHLGITPRDDQLLPGFGTPLYRQLGKFASEGIEEMAVDYRNFNIENHDRMVQIFPGVQETLRELTERGIKLAIVTSKLRQISQQGLDLFDLNQYITLMVSMEDTEKHKPDPLPVLKALELLGAKAEETLFLGDSPHDIAAGKGAGVKTAAALWGPHKKEVLEAAQPDYLLSSITELIPIVLEDRG